MSKDLLEELISSSKAQNETAKSLDNKATTMITISATTTSLLIGFATALLSRINPHFFFFNHLAILLVVGLILTIISIVIFLVSARP
jgi:predicted RND superfamily exporter protein